MREINKVHERAIEEDYAMDDVKQDDALQIEQGDDALEMPQNDALQMEQGDDALEMVEKRSDQPLNFCQRMVNWLIGQDQTYEDELG